MRGRLTLWAVAVLLTIAVVGWSLRYMDPFPPRHIVLATGQPDGAYDTFGREYQRRLAREGLRVEIRSTAGSLENLDRLLRADVDVAFVQGCTYPLVADPSGVLRGMAAVYRDLAAPLQDPPVAHSLARQPDPRAPLRAVARRGGGRRERRPAPSRLARGSRAWRPCAPRSRGSRGGCRSSTSAMFTTAACTSPWS